MALSEGASPDRYFSRVSWGTSDQSCRRVSHAGFYVLERTNWRAKIFTLSRLIAGFQ